MLRLCSDVMLRQSKAHERARAYVAVTKQATRSKSDCDAEINSLRSYNRHRTDRVAYIKSNQARPTLALQSSSISYVAISLSH